MLGARDARPCVELVPMRVLPASASAPINTHVWVHAPPMQLHGNQMRLGATPFDAEIVLREVAPSVRNHAVTVRECPYKFLDVAPLAPLPMNARFEVWMAPASPEPTAPPPTLLASFATGDARDDAPPSRPAVTSAYFTKESIRTSCGTTFPVTLVGARPPPDTLYAVWAAPASGPIAWDAPPIAVLGGMVLDTHATCMANYPAWAQSSPRLGVRAIDLAGNASEPVEISVR
jgi:hypothetical protein